MTISELKDNIMILKDSVRSAILQNPLLQDAGSVDMARKAVRHIGLRGIDKIIIGKPNTLIIVTNDTIVKMPMDRLSTARCRLNKMMLKKLCKTGISSFVPRFLKEGRFDGQPYYCETRLPGAAIDIPLNRMDELVIKAADFITEFHKETAQEITIDEIYFKRLFAKSIVKLSYYLKGEYKEKLLRLEKMLKKRLIGKRLKTVWFHGDYKVENVLFDKKHWGIRGVIDWDLSRERGLPLLDIFYLLLYRDSMLTGKDTSEIFADRFLKLDFVGLEREIIAEYINITAINSEFIRPMLLMYWINHLIERYRKQFENNTTDLICNDLYGIIDKIAEIK
ncbi:MAG: aminoglycoside phosphotransferase family protein [Candidatus Omnitrophota bacterium]